jgi:hypothetical protein
LADLLTGNRPKTGTRALNERHATRPSQGRTQPSWLATHKSSSKLKSAYAKQTTPRVETDSSDSVDKLWRGDAQDPRRRRASPPNRPLKVIVHRSHSSFDFTTRRDRKEVTRTRRKQSRLTRSCRNQTLAYHHCRCHTSLHSEHPHHRLASCQHRCRVCPAAGAREEDQNLQDDALKRGSDERSTPSSDSANENLGFHPKT